MSEYVGHPFEHPIIYLNSIKNIIGDDKKTPSKILLDSLDKVSNSIPKREDDQKILEILNEILRDLKNYELEYRISELESKFSQDLSEDTFNELKELKKQQNIN